MHPRFRRFALVLATVGLLVSLFIALRPDDDDDDAAGTTTMTTTTVETTTAATTTEPPPATTEPPPATTTAPPPEPAFDTVRVTVVGGQPQGGVKRATIEQGRDVVLVVRADVSDHIHLHGYDLMADVAPGAPARLRFTADVPGRFEVELEDRGVQIADLQVRP
jgi:heme/copper-type cytochrome/quinol oxidase subunit 2